MYPISDQQIDFILNDISGRGIRMEDLQLNLLDHICILIEENLEEGGDFEKFYASVITAFYTKELAEIEEETLFLLTNKNRLSMKRAMIISGTFSVAAFLAASLSKILNTNLTDFMIFLGFLSFVFLFLPLVFLVKFREANTRQDKLIMASGTLVGILYFFCMLLKFLGPGWPPFLGQRWANMDSIWLTLWLISLGVALFVFIPAYFLTGMQRPETKTNTIVISVLLVVFVGIQFRFTNLHPLRTEKIRVSAQVGSSPETKRPSANDVNKVMLVSYRVGTEQTINKTGK